MSRGPCTFRQRDLTAAMKAVEAAGVPLGHFNVEIVHLDGIPAIRINTFAEAACAHVVAPKLVEDATSLIG